MRPITLLKLFGFCILMLIVRAVKTQHYAFFFLLWNLLLAVVPYLLIRQYPKVKSQGSRYLILFLSLLFSPNAPYILTDLFHLTKNLRAPLWFDLVLILNFSLLGLCLFVLTTECIFTILESHIRSKLLLTCTQFLIILSNGYGIYLGRYLRFNSWDILSNPYHLALQMFYSLFGSNNYKETFSVTFTFTIFLYLIYETYKSFKISAEAKQNELL